MKQRFRDWMVPDEWQAAVPVLAEVIRSSKKTSHFWIKQIIGLSLPFVCGALIVYLTIHHGGADAQPSFKQEVAPRLATAVIAFAAIVSGFMITLMLATGRTDGTADLNEVQAQKFKEKITYILLVQGLSVCAHILTAVSSLTWLLMLSVGASDHYLQCVMIGIGGFVTVSIIRTVLVPIHIFELHAFTLSALVSSKQEEAKKRVEQHMATVREELKSKASGHVA